MYLGNYFTVPARINLPGQFGGSAPAFEYTAIDNSFSMEFDGASSYYYGPPLGDLIDLDPATSTLQLAVGYMHHP